MKGTHLKNGKLNGKVAVVTGASKGTGAGIAKEFAAEGASVVVNYESAKQDADRVVDEISKRGGKGSPKLKAFTRAPSLGLSQWENGNLTTNLAEKKDTNGAFLLVEAMLAPGTEPPPHVHTRKDELFNVLEGEFDVYVGEEAFNVKAGECVFMPRFRPHAFVIRSPRLRLLALFTPAGLEEVFRGMKQTAQRLSEYGARFLTPDEVADQLPLYPKSLPSNAGKFTADTRMSHTRRPSPTARKGVNYG
jgi:mannose-6-phosphate isomerase-like protein (cupin superfamily)